MTELEKYVNAPNFIRLEEHELYYLCRMKSLKIEGRYWDMEGKRIVKETTYEMAVPKPIPQPPIDWNPRNDANAEAVPPQYCDDCEHATVKGSSIPCVGCKIDGIMTNYKPRK